MDAARLRPLGVGEVLDVAVKIYRERFGTLVKAVAVVVVPVSILTAVVQLSIDVDDSRSTTFVSEPADPFAPAEPDQFEDVDGAEAAAALAGFLVVGALTWLATQLAAAASFAVVSGAYVDQRPTWRESLAFARRRLRSLVWLQIIYGILLFLAFIACVIPGIYFWVAWAVSVPVLLFEDRRGRRALSRSRELLKGRWWPTAAVLLLVTILTGIVQTAISGVLVAVVATTDSGVAYVIAQSISGSISSVLTTPFSAAVTTVLFFDGLVRKEGFDLAQLAHGIGVEPPATDELGVARSASPNEAAPEAGLPSDQPPYWPPPPGWRPGS